MTCCPKYRSTSKNWKGNGPRFRERSPLVVSGAPSGSEVHQTAHFEKSNIGTPSQASLAAHIRAELNLVTHLGWDLSVRKHAPRPCSPDSPIVRQRCLRVRLIAEDQ